MLAYRAHGYSRGGGFRDFWHTRHPRRCRTPGAHGSHCRDRLFLFNILGIADIDFVRCGGFGRDRVDQLGGESGGVRQSLPGGRHSGCDAQHDACLAHAFGVLPGSGLDHHRVLSSAARVNGVARSDLNAAPQLTAGLQAHTKEFQENVPIGWQWSMPAVMHVIGKGFEDRRTGRRPDISAQIVCTE